MYCFARAKAIVNMLLFSRKAWSPGNRGKDERKYFVSMIDAKKPKREKCYLIEEKNHARLRKYCDLK